MRRLITCFNALLLGMILGMIFLAIIHTPPSHWQEEVPASGITIGNEILEAKSPTPAFLIAGMTTQLVHLPEEFCAYLADQGRHASSSIIARSASFVGSSGYLQFRALRKL